MAKSIRSKWKRKMRSIKRVKNNVRDMERLNRIASKETIIPDTTLLRNEDGVMVLGTRLPRTRPKEGTKRGEQKRKKNGPIVLEQDGDDEEEEEVMEVEEEENVEAPGTDVAPKFNPKTMQDANGRYPVWMNQRRLKQMNAKKKKIKKRINMGRK